MSLESGDVVKCVIVPYDEYKELMSRSLTAPKVRPALTGKQKGKLNDAMAEVAIVNVQRKTAYAAAQPLGEMIERKTMH